MVVKQKGGKRKNIIRSTADAPHEKEVPVKKDPLVPKTPMSSRPKEENAGFGVLKAVGGMIAVLIIGSAILFNRAGGRDATRGDKLQGESCENTEECSKGFVCFSYQGEVHRCMKTCSSKHPCESGMTCVSAASSKRKGIRVREVCVLDAAQ